MNPRGNIYLIGPMGVGKTTVGRALAKQLGLEFVDSDAEIEERTGVTITTIFDIEGEDGFRIREEKMIAELTRRQNIVLATGGGVVLSEANRRCLRQNGTVVYLHASVDMQMDRTRNSKNRPLLDGKDREKVLTELMAEREPLYRQEADLVFTTDSRSAHAVARDVIKEIKAKWQC